MISVLLVGTLVSSALTQNSDSSRLQTELRTALSALENTELAITKDLNQPSVKSSPGKRAPKAQLQTDSIRDRHATALRRAKTLLDTAILMRPWGKTELEWLHAAYPGSVLLNRYDALLAVRDGRATTALSQYDALLRRMPLDAELHRERGAVLDRLHRSVEATWAYERALELVPEDSIAFRALLELHGRRGTLNELLTQVQRLRTRSTESAVLREREIELLHRLGRLKEAAALSAEAP